MGKRVDTVLGQITNQAYAGAGTNYIVQTNDGTLYVIFVDAALDVSYRKSTDRGLSWSDLVQVFSGTVQNLAVWYDRWSNISAGLIHLAYTESTGFDTLYRTIDTASADALSTQTTIFNGVSTAAGGHLSIARARGGNVYCKTCIDAGAEGGFFRLLNANVPNGAWDAALTVDETLATTDQMILVPGFATDSNDMLAIFWDASADEISRKLYDDSANTWAETSIATSMVDLSAANSFPHFAAAVDLTNSRIVMVAWSAVDTANADLRCWTVTESAITEVTNVVLNSTDDQGLCAVSIDDKQRWWVTYGGKSDGSEVWGTVNLYQKYSIDAGTTWSSETALTTTVRDTKSLWAIPRITNAAQIVTYYFNTAIADELHLTYEVSLPTARSLVGV